MDLSEDVWAVLEEWSPRQWWSSVDAGDGDRQAVARVWWVIVSGETKSGRAWISVTHMGYGAKWSAQVRIPRDAGALRRTMRALDAAAKAYDAAMEDGDGAE